MRTRNLLSWFVFIALTAGLLVALLNLQAIIDWWKLRDYQPSNRVVELADHTTMKDGTRRLFYINRPELNDKPTFRQKCGDTSEKTIILGCFIDQRGIYLLDVTDERLNGVVEVTAAHEILHAHYARLEDSERAEVDKMTADAFAHVTDERVRKTVDDYRAKDASIVPNELHSILATEVRDLTPELETYYSKYFSDRKKIVSYSEQYEQEFIDIETKAERYDERLSELKTKIDSGKVQIDSLGAEIEAEQRRLDRLRSSGNIEQYNSSVPAYNDMVNRYNSLVNQIKQSINTYNNLLEERNNLSIQLQELYEVIDANSIDEKAR